MITKNAVFGFLLKHVKVIYSNQGSESHIVFCPTTMPKLFLLITSPKIAHILSNQNVKIICCNQGSKSHIFFSKLLLLIKGSKITQIAHKHTDSSHQGTCTFLTPCTASAHCGGATGGPREAQLGAGAGDAGQQEQVPAWTPSTLPPRWLCARRQDQDVGIESHRSPPPQWTVA